MTVYNSPGDASGVEIEVDEGRPRVQISPAMLYEVLEFGDHSEADYEVEIPTGNFLGMLELLGYTPEVGE